MSWKDLTKPGGMLPGRWVWTRKRRVRDVVYKYTEKPFPIWVEEKE